MKKQFENMKVAEQYFTSHGFRIQKNRYTPDIETAVSEKAKFDLVPVDEVIEARKLMM